MNCIKVRSWSYFIFRSYFYLLPYFQHPYSTVQREKCQRFIMPTVDTTNILQGSYYMGQPLHDDKHDNVCFISSHHRQILNYLQKF